MTDLPEKEQEQKHLPTPVGDSGLVLPNNQGLASYDPNAGIDIRHFLHVLKTPEVVLSEWLNRRTELTRRNYESDLRGFADWANQKGASGGFQLLIEVGQIDAQNLVAEYKSWLLKNTTEAPNTINRKLSSIRSLLKAARMAGLIDWTITVENVEKKIIRNTASPGLGRVIDMMRYFLDQGRNGRPSGYRDATALKIMLREGWRKMEVYGLDLRAWNPNDQTLTVQRKRWPRPMAVQIQNDSAAHLKWWLEQRGPRPGAIFCSYAKGKEWQALHPSSINNVYNRAGQALGISPCNPHAVGRHTFGTEGAKRLDILQLMKAMGHKNLASTQAYIDSLREGRWEAAEEIAKSMELPDFATPEYSLLVPEKSKETGQNEQNKAKKFKEQKKETKPKEESDGHPQPESESESYY